MMIDVRSPFADQLDDYLDSHWGKDNQVAKVETKSREEETELILLYRRGRPPRMEISERGHRDCGTHRHHGEVGREHLALKVAELVPRQISAIYHAFSTQIDTIKENGRKVPSSSVFCIIDDWNKKGGVGKGDRSILLEHDDAADEGYPEGRSPGSREGEQVEELSGGDGGRGGVGARAEYVGREYDADGEERHRRQKACRPRHRRPPRARDRSRTRVCGGRLGRWA